MGERRSQLSGRAVLRGSSDALEQIAPQPAVAGDLIPATVPNLIPVPVPVPTAAIRLAAHSLKGSSLTLGGQALGDMFAGCENLANAGDFAQARQLLARNDALVQASLAALAQAATPG